MNILKTTITTFLIALSISSQAELVVGNNGVVTDTNTGIQWLSFNETRSMSANEFVANNEFSGFSIANREQVNTLYNAYTDVPLSELDQYNRKMLGANRSYFDILSNAFGYADRVGHNYTQFSYGIYSEASSTDGYALYGVDASYRLSDNTLTASALWINHQQSGPYTGTYSNDAYSIWAINDASYDSYLKGAYYNPSDVFAPISFFGATLALVNLIMLRRKNNQIKSKGIFSVK